MITAIEQILNADETAREKVAAARIEADAIRSHAERTAQEMLSTRMQELDDAIRGEQDRVLTDAQSQASQIAAEADLYIADLQRNKQAIQTDLIENLLKKVIGP
jgi:vacuolar-type H+-ATPase subunit H